MSDHDLLAPEFVCAECGVVTRPDDSNVCAFCFEAGAPLVGGDVDELPPDPAREALLDAAAASTYATTPKPLTVAEERLWRVVAALEQAMDVARDLTRRGSSGEREMAEGLIGILDALHDLACGRSS